MTTLNKAPQETIFHHNQDFSDNVIVSKDGHELQIPGGNLLRFVAYQYVAKKIIVKVESMDWEELLAHSVN